MLLFLAALIVIVFLAAAAASLSQDGSEVREPGEAFTSLPIPHVPFLPAAPPGLTFLWPVPRAGDGEHTGKDDHERTESEQAARHSPTRVREAEDMNE